jgi:hypothetical protein
MNTPRLRAILASVLSLLVAVGLVVTITDNGPDHPPDKPRRTVTVTIGGAGAPKSTVTLPPTAQIVASHQAAEAAAGNEQAAHSDLHETSPPTAAAAAAARKLTPAGQPVLPRHPPLAAVHTPGCQTHLVRNFSSRGGAPILLFVIHYTVSTDNGWAGVLGNVKWFDSPAAQASSNYIIDRRIGACALVVAEASKAWAQASFNPWALSVEITARGNEGSLVEGAGKARLLALMRRAHDVYGIPYRHGAVTQAGCRVTRTGFVIHKDLGQCGGGHVDTTPYSIDPLITAAAATSRPHVTASDRAACKQIRAYRDRRKAHKPITRAGKTLFERRLALEHARGLRCVDGKAKVR